MNPTRVDRCFTDLRKARKKGFVAYITAGDPDLRATAENIMLLEDAGVDIVELGIPFSDPLADGKVNQAAAERALRAGTTYERILECVSAVRKHSEMPLIFFSYLNPLLAHGFETTVRGAAQAGVDGFLILDLPVEEMAPYQAVLNRFNLNNVCLVAPTSPTSRIRKIVRCATGFVYCVSREGVTGKQKELSAVARQLVLRTRALTKLPVALGFGVSGPLQAARAAETADAVVVGSAIVEALSNARSTNARRRVAQWIRQMVIAVKQAGER